MTAGVCNPVMDRRIRQPCGLLNGQRINIGANPQHHRSRPDIHPHTCWIQSVWLEAVPLQRGNNSVSRAMLPKGQFGVLVHVTTKLDRAIQDFSNGTGNTRQPGIIPDRILLAMREVLWFIGHSTSSSPWALMDSTAALTD